MSVAASGFSGRGYKAIFDEGSPLVPSVTTALSALEKPGLRQWERSQIAAYAVTHVDEIKAKDEEIAYRYLMAVPKFLTPEKADELPEEVDLWHAAEFVLNDLADTGTWIHNYIEDDLLDRFPTEPIREDHVEMVEAWHNFRANHDIEVVTTEATIFGDGFAGTLDAILTIDGVTGLYDVKSSRKVHDSHIAQLSALGAAHTMAREVTEGTEGAVYHKLQPKVSEAHGGQVDSWWVADALPDFRQYGVIQVRPGDWDSNGTYVEPFCELHLISHDQVTAAYDLFRAGLSARLAQAKLKALQKEAR